MSVRLIAHVLVKHGEHYLLIKRSQVKRGTKNVYPCYWDIPGGSVEEGELPLNGAVRECFEEAGLQLDAKKLKIIHEDSNFDKEKQTVFTRLVYMTEITGEWSTICLDPEEHTDYKWVMLEAGLAEEKLVPYVQMIFETKHRLKS